MDLRYPEWIGTGVSPRVFAVAGAKGGVGKTTTTLELAATFATAGYEVVVVEADLMMANAVDFLDLQVESAPTLHDVLADATPVAQATHAAPGGFDIVPAGLDIEEFAAADVASLSPVVEQFRSNYQAVLIDTPAGATRETLYPVRIADATVLVSTPRAASVRAASKTVELVEHIDGTVRAVVVTKAGVESAPPSERIAEFLGVDLLGEVPDDDAVPAAQNAGRPITAHAPDSAAAAAYREIGTRLSSSLVGSSTEQEDGNDFEPTVGS